MANKTRTVLIGLIASIILVIFDQYTKVLAVAKLKDQQPFVIIKGVFELQYLENHGAAFGILQGQKIFLVLFTAILLLLMVFLYLHTPSDRKYHAFRGLLIMVFAGAIGNMIDRVRFDYVVDFFYFKLIDFPIFNVADCYVTVAIFLFAILILFYYKEEDLDFLFHPFGWKSGQQ